MGDRCFRHSAGDNLILDEPVQFTDGLSCVCRWAVLFVFPQFVGHCILTRTAMLFKRGSIADKVVSTAFRYMP